MSKNKKLLFSSLFLLIGFSLWSQTMASFHAINSQWKEDILTSPVSFDFSPTSTSDFDKPLSVEEYLAALISEDQRVYQRDDYNSLYRHIVDHLEDLRQVHGDDPWFFEGYFHPHAQQMTGYNFGRAGLPLPKFDTLSDGTVKLDLHSETPKSKIHYTLDGSTPDETSPVWNESMPTKEGVTIKAKTIRSDLEHSDVLVIAAGEPVFTEIPGEELNEDKIMGIFAVPYSEDVIIKYKTGEQGFISVSLIDDQRQVYFIDEFLAMDARFGTCRIDTSDIAEGAYLIKFRFDSGKTTYRQMLKE